MSAFKTYTDVLLNDATAASITEAGGNIESVCVALANQKQELLDAVQFQSAQIERLAGVAFSIPPDEWLRKCDAYQYGLRALKKFGRIPDATP